MKNILVLFLAFFLLMNCKNQESNSIQKNTESVSNTQDCIPYFDFDEVEYYSINIEEDKVWDLYDKSNITNNEKKLLSILSEPLENISDSLFISKVEDLGFSKKLIPSEKFGELNDVLCQRKPENFDVASCVPIYRDILVLKNKNRINGIIKICFDCSQINIVGTNKDTGLFSRYSQLSGVLNN